MLVFQEASGAENLSAADGSVAFVMWFHGLCRQRICLGKQSAATVVQFDPKSRTGKFVRYCVYKVWADEAKLVLDRDPDHRILDEQKLTSLIPNAVHLFNSHASEWQVQPLPLGVTSRPGPRGHLEKKYATNMRIALEDCSLFTVLSLAKDAHGHAPSLPDGEFHISNARTCLEESRKAWCLYFAYHVKAAQNTLVEFSRQKRLD